MADCRHLVKQLLLMFTLAVVLAVADRAHAQDAPPAEEAAPVLPEVLLQPEIDTDELTSRLVPLTNDELAALAEEWLGIVKAKTEEVMEAQLAIDATEGSGEEAARERLTQSVQERLALFDKYTTIVNAWELKGGDEEAIADLRAYRSAIVVEETRSADFKTLLAQVVSWLTAEDGGIALAKSVGIVLVAVIVLMIVARIVRRLVRRWIGHVETLSKLLQAFIVAVVYWLVLAFGLMIVLSALGVNITPMFALIGGASFILAFALQDTIGNLASGLMIMINRPFDEGDYIDVGGVAGTVKSMSVVATTVTTPDNQIIIIPNKQIWGNVITNVTASPTRRVDLAFGISYDDSMADAVAIIEQAVNEHPLVLRDPAPLIKVNELQDSAVSIVCRPWVASGDYWTVYFDLTRQIKERFDEGGISIPYPQQDVHIRTAAPASSADPVSPASPRPPGGPAERYAAGDEAHET